MAQEEKKDRLGFTRRYHGDTRFKAAVEDLQRELTWASLGVDSDFIARSWDGQKLNVSVDELLAARVSVDERGAKKLVANAVKEVEAALEASHASLLLAQTQVSQLKNDLQAALAEIEALKAAQNTDEGSKKEPKAKKEK